MTKTPLPSYIYFFVASALIVVIAFVGKIAFWLAWVSVGDYLISKWTIPMPTILANPEIKWTQEMENKRLEALKPKEVEKPTPKVEKKQEPIKEVKIDTKCTSKVRLDLVNHAYKISGGDMKFLGTISSESSWDIWAIWDWGMSVGLCQFHKHFQPDNHREYQKLDSDFKKLEFCFEKYSIWKKKGVLSTRLYGSNVWQNWLKKLEIKCQ